MAPVTSNTGTSLAPNSVPDVPSETTRRPRVAPTPLAAQALSPDPVATRHPAGNPVDSAAARDDAHRGVGRQNVFREHADEAFVDGVALRLVVPPRAHIENTQAARVPGFRGDGAGEPEVDVIAR